MKKLNGLRVLLVDDEEELREILTDDFTFHGAKVIAANSGNNALKAIKTEKFDFVLSDMRMPDGDGKFLIKKINEIPNDKPVLFLYTGFNDISQDEASKLGIKEVFNKPFVTSELIDSIAKHFKKSVA
jgi:DNA-binding NtrC family response regulator